MQWAFLGVLLAGVFALFCASVRAGLQKELQRRRSLVWAVPFALTAYFLAASAAAGQVSWELILIVLGYFLILPPLLARTVLRSYFIRMGFFRYIVLVNLMLFMASLPVKMVLRWTMNLKYIVAIPEYFFNI